MKKQLKRSSGNRFFAGVLAGLAEYFEHDVLVWRLGFVILLIATGLMPGVFFYLAAWLMMPSDAKEAPVSYRVVED